MLKLKNLKIALGLFLLFTAAACTTNVAPWERGNLAKPQMALEPDVLDAAIINHMFSSKEASSGGYGVGGGGCGCN